MPIFSSDTSTAKHRHDDDDDDTYALGIKPARVRFFLGIICLC